MYVACLHMISCIHSALFSLVVRATVYRYMFATIQCRVPSSLAIHLLCCVYAP